MDNLPIRLLDVHYERCYLERRCPDILFLEGPLLAVPLYQQYCCINIIWVVWMILMIDFSSTWTMRYGGQIFLLQQNFRTVWEIQPGRMWQTWQCILHWTRMFWRVLSKRWVMNYLACPDYIFSPSPSSLGIYLCSDSCGQVLGKS